jgi:hypothetical protein
MVVTLTGSEAKRRGLDVEIARKARERRSPAALGEAVLMDEKGRRASEGLDARA